MRPMKTFTRNRRRKFIESYQYAPDFIATLEIAERHAIPMVLFTADEDSGYREGYTYSTADLHRMRDTYSHRPRARKRRYATYSGSSGYAGGCGGFFGDSGGGGSDGGGGGGGRGGGGGGGGGGGVDKRGGPPLGKKP